MMSSLTKYRLTTLGKSKIMGCVLGLMLPALGVAQNNSPISQSLTPMQKNNAQFVGQSLLMAKRKAVVPNANEAAQLRESVEILKDRLITLLQPEPVGQLTFVEGNAEAVNSQQNNVQQRAALASTQSPVRRQRLNQLAQAMERVSKQSSTLHGKRQKMQQTQHSFWQRARALVLGNSNTRQNDVHPILVSVSDEALTRLELLNTEIEVALALPASEQHQALRGLIKQISVSRQLLPIENNVSSVTDEIERSPDATPTMAARTAHRRQFSWD